MKTLACIALLLTPLAATATSGGDAYYELRISELELLEGELPNPEGFPRGAWQLSQAMWPYAVIEGEGDVFYDPRIAQGSSWWEAIRNHSQGFLLVRTAERRDVRGTLYLPASDWSGMVPLTFELSASSAVAKEEAFLRAEMTHYQRLLASDYPGAAWFRHRRDSASESLGGETVEQPLGLGSRRRNGELIESYQLFSGGRAVAENLQLERLVPTSDEAAEKTVELSDIEGVTVREMDWGPLIKDKNPELDPLAALIPADQHAVFFPGFEALIQIADEAAELGAPFLALFEQSSQDAGTRQRYERQLCLELDAFARLFGPKLIRSVAFTGSDPYLRTGSDVAVIFETPQAEALFRVIQQRQNASGAAEVEITQQLEAMADGELFSAVATPGRGVSSYAAVIGGAVVVTNSTYQLRAIHAANSSEGASLSESPEYRFFRDRYTRGASEESALLILPDAAIRRWCNPRWRITASRRTRAAAVLTDLTAEHFGELSARERPERPLEADARFPGMGELSLTPDGVHSSTYGTADFQTPISELAIEKVTQREAELYRAWRTGYSRNWSRFFDPIALRMEVKPEQLGLDLTVMPLILGSDYNQLRDFVGGARLGPTSGDPHEGAAIHLTFALDPEGETLRDAGEMLAGMITQVGANPLSWMGGSVGIYLDNAPFWRELLASDDPQAARERLLKEVNEIPLVVVFDVSSGLKLGAFLATMRGFLDQTAPGLLRWNDVTREELRFVRITSSDDTFDDHSLFYATPPKALVFSLNEAALLRCLRRLEENRAIGGEATPENRWLGEAVAGEAELEGLRLLQMLMEDELRNEIRKSSWSNLPILNEWKRLRPERDPVAFHRAVWGSTLRCPGGGTYVWNEEFQTMESTVFGHPGQHRLGVDLPPALRDIERLRFGLDFENDGLRSKLLVERGHR